ncbi:DUF2804 domain-containing protein [Lysinibacillus sp. BW-2-10]|uniref:DUF2804 domain-containing protein n=1 Tax=Lysinibacillus sp. BW-2-10 TaxID=2590030 RepID=UPI0011808086|nr:DUF2804 domain-containing protein [Lysinibacillus sp. BW-2-10]TSI05966.1 DUF2804 domain-containing protein [Lysinibacillus sp. BW-2-10]
MTQHAEREIVNLTRLCDNKGNLNPEAIGYARKPIIDSNLSGHFLRKKKWNYWCVFGEEILFSVTVCHFDYAAVCFIYFLEYETQRFFEKSVTIPLGIGSKLKMPTRVLEPLRFSNNEVNLHITHLQNQTFLNVTSSNFDNEELHAELMIHHPQDDESLNVVVPWNRQTFQFTAKHHTLPTTGMVKIGNRTFHFSAEDCFAVLDFGRGIWPREALWNWGMASQQIRDKRIGLNFGGHWTDGTGMTENAVFVNGKMTKIHEDVIFSYDRSNFMKPWYITTKFSDQVMLSFHPFFERVAQTNAKLVKSEVHQMVGYYGGQVKLDDGSTLTIHQMLGCIEEHVAKW